MKKVIFLLTIFICLSLLIFRFWLAINAKHGDMYNNIDWGQIAFSQGLSGFYNLPSQTWPHSAPNQPAGSIYLHVASVALDRSIMSLIWYLNNSFTLFPSPLVWWWEWHGSLITIKYFSLLADFVIAAVILHLARYYHRPRLGTAVAAAFLINPALWYNSSFWGQTDAVVAALSLVALAFLLSGRLFWSSFFLGLSLATKASWMPLLPLYALYFWLHYRTKIWYLILIPAVIIGAFAPFHPHLGLPVWLSSLYFHRLLPGETAFITILAFNFWNIIFGPYGVPHTVPVLGIPANVLGWAMVALITFLLIRKYFQRLDFASFLFSAALLFFAVFLFAPKMIHRYLYPAFPLLFATVVAVRRPRLLIIILIVLSCLYLVNIYYRWWAPGLDWLIAFYTPGLLKLVSVAYLVIFIWLLRRYLISYD